MSYDQIRNRALETLNDSVPRPTWTKGSVIEFQVLFAMQKFSENENSLLQTRITELESVLTIKRVEALTTDLLDKKTLDEKTEEPLDKRRMKPEHIDAIIKARWLLEDHSQQDFVSKYDARQAALGLENVLAGTIPDDN